MKISYSSVHNFGSIINSHNERILNNSILKLSTPLCNCRVKDSFPLHGQCLQSHKILQKIELIKLFKPQILLKRDFVSIKTWYAWKVSYRRINPKISALRLNGMYEKKPKLTNQSRRSVYYAWQTNNIQYSQNEACWIQGLNWIGLDWNALFHVDKIIEKKNQINECIIQVLAHINRYV